MPAKRSAAPEGPTKGRGILDSDPNNPGADTQTRAQLNAEWQDIRAKLTKLDAEATRRQAEIATVQASIAKLEATVPMAQTREADFKQLVNQGYILNP